MFQSDSDKNSDDEDHPKCDTWYPSKEELPTSDLLTPALSRHNVSKIQFGDVTIQFLKRTCVLETLKSENDADVNICKAEESHSDLIPTKYEGGLKIWECCNDLGKWMLKNEKLFEERPILDLGCGAGLLGIIALYMSASSVHFQDYNCGVIKHWTIPNVMLNVGELENCRFWSGDWEDFNKEGNMQYDVIVSSETIYNPDNHHKLSKLIQRSLRPSGVALFSAKSYYFGIGGSSKQFSSLLKNEAELNCETIWKSSEGVQREILEIRWKS